eukprot:TRINITY_DN1588_c0_g1_i2.p2 TRINITY_DN1588_c0_g1~~TRINITY_DN1588_c0_g1_i2.p2  ORF type:complete len:119 (-),score=20.11 TRINITY_DN1588_c0_g1_i2:543-899(-)
MNEAENHRENLNGRVQIEIRRSEEDLTTVHPLKWRTMVSLGANPHHQNTDVLLHRSLDGRLHQNPDVHPHLKKQSPPRDENLDLDSHLKNRKWCVFNHRRPTCKGKGESSKSGNKFKD